MKLPLKFRLRQAWELIAHGTDTRYEACLTELIDSGKKVTSLEASMKRMEVAHREDLNRAVETIKDTVKPILEKASSLDWREGVSRSYKICMSFDPEYMSLTTGNLRGIELMAEMMGNRVRHEIQTCRFVQAAEEHTERKNQSQLQATRLKSRKVIQEPNDE